MARQALALLALLLLAGLGLLALLRDADPRAAAPLPATRPDHPAREVTGPNTPLAPDSEPAPDVEREARASGRTEAATTRVLPVRVILPVGTPADEELWVAARARDTDTVVEARVLDSNVIELSLPAELAHGVVTLRGRYLYDEPVLFDLDAPSAYPIELSPELGARVLVEVELPPQYGPTDELLAAARVTARAGNRQYMERMRELDASWTAFFDALPVNVLWDVDANHPRFCDTGRDRLKLEPGQSVRLTLQLQLGVQLSGRVTHADGRPAAGCEVTARTRWSSSEAFAEGALTGTTDARGAFEIVGQRPGRVALMAEADGSVRARFDTEHLDHGAQVTGIELVLGTGDRIAGRVLWPDGSPAEDAWVQLGSQYRGYASRKRLLTDATGTFEFVALTGAPYRVSAKATEDERTLRALLHHIAPDSEGLELRLHPGNRVAGRVLDDAGEPVERFRVFAQQLAAGNAAGLEQLDERFRDEDGRFVFDDLPAGDWRLTASASHHELSTSQDLTLPDSAGAEWELVLTREASISGTVLDSDGSPAQAGEVRIGTIYSGRKTEIEADGSFELAGLEPGVHDLRARGVDSAWGPRVDVRIAPGEERTGVELEVSRSGTITGGLHTSLANRESLSIQLANLDYTFSASTTSDAEGRFAFEHLAPDTYRVYIQFTGTGGLNREWAENYAARAEEQVELAEGEQRDIVLGAPRTDELLVHGQLLLNGEPLENQLVYAYPGPPHLLFPVTTGFAGEAGHFELRLPGPGDYAFTSSPAASLGFGRRLDVPGPGPFELIIELGRGSISGFLLGSNGEPRPAHTLLLRRAAAIADSRRPGDMLVTKTDAEGAFQFMNLEDGRWELRSGGFSGDHRKRSEGLAIRSDLHITDGNALTEIVLHLRPGALLTGTCFAADGAPAADAQLIVLYADGSRMLPFTAERTTWDGSFHIPAIDPGRIEVYAELDGAQTPSTHITLSAGESGYVELAFE